MENRTTRKTRIAVVSTAALVALSLFAIPAAEAQPVWRQPPPPAYRVQPVRYTPAQATYRISIAADARAHLAALRGRLMLTDSECAMFDPLFVQAAWQAQAIRAQGAMAPAGHPAIQAIWQALDARIQEALIAQRRADFDRSRGQRDSNEWRGRDERGRDSRNDGGARNGNDRQR
jgi:hypothetical protein